MTTATHTTFATTSARGLRHTILPMRLYHKAKKLGVWDPRDIDFTRDKQDWHGLSDLEKQSILQLSSLFMAGEESVTLDLLPLMMAVAETRQSGSCRPGPTRRGGMIRCALPACVP